jgi:hypothetical protein
MEPNIHCGVRKSPPPDLIQSEMHLLHVLKPVLALTFTFMHWSSKWSVFFSYSERDFFFFCVGPCVVHLIFHDLISLIISDEQ